MELVVTEIRQETPEIKSFRFDLGSETPFSFRPGQFIIITAEVWNPRRNRTGPANRAFSISSSPTDEGFIEIAAKRYPHGRLTTWLHDTVKTGDSLKIKGPEGKFVFTDGESDSIVLIAGGIGIAPYRSMIRYILNLGLKTRVKLLYSARTADEFAFKPEFDAAMKEHDNFECVYTIPRPNEMPWRHRIGRFDEAFFRTHLENTRTHYYICGPAVMIRDQTAILTALGVDPGLIHSERW